MLSEEAEERVVERLVNRIEQANTYVLERIANTMKEIGTLTPSRAYELSQVFKYGGDYEKIVNELAKITNLNVNEIYEIFDEVARSDYEFAKQFYDYRGMNYIPYDENIALQNQVRAMANMTAQTYMNLSNTSSIGFGFVDEITGETSFKGLQQTYYDVVDEAVMSISQGKETYQQAVSRTINQLGGSGLKVVYDSGYTRRLDSAVRMNIKTGMRDLHNKTQEIFGQEFGANGVEVSVHGNPAVDHADVQGRQFSTERKDGQPSEWEKLNTLGYATDYKGKLIDIRTVSKKGNVSFRPISTLNCYHKAFSVILGISEPEYTDEQLEEINEENEKGFELDERHYTNYEGTQLQRRLETAIREQKDKQIMARKNNRMDEVDKAQKRIRQLTTKYNELANISGLPKNVDRLKVEGYERIKVNLPKKKMAVKENSILKNKTYTISKETDPEFKNFKTMKLYVEGNQIGYLEYQNNKGNITVNVIETDEKYRGQGVASRLLEELKNENGDITYKFSAVLSDGAKLLQKRAKIIKKEYGDYYVKLK